MYGYGTYDYGFNPITGEDLNPNAQRGKTPHPPVNPFSKPPRRTPFYPFEAPRQSDFGHLPQYAVNTPTYPYYYPENVVYPPPGFGYDPATSQPQPQPTQQNPIGQPGISLQPNQAYVDPLGYLYPMAQYDYNSGTMQYHHQYIPTPYPGLMTPGVSFAQHPYFANPSAQNIKTEPQDEQEAYSGESVDATVDALSTLSMTSEEERTFSAQYDECNVAKSAYGQLHPICYLKGPHKVTQQVQTDVSEPFYDYEEPQQYEWPQESDYTIQPEEAVTTKDSDLQVEPQEPIYQNCDPEFVDYMAGLEDFKQYYTDF